MLQCRRWEERKLGRLEENLRDKNVPPIDRWGFHSTKLMAQSNPAKGFYMSNKAVILLSGGLDSTTLMAIAAQEGYDLYPITFSYGQRHENEISCAKKIASVFYAKEHMIFDIDLAKIGGSSLTSSVPVPKGRGAGEISASIPSTYVPARNTIFLSIALARAETIASRAIFIGVNSIDWSGYPDCRPEYIRAFQNMADLATKPGLKIKKK